MKLQLIDVLRLALLGVFVVNFCVIIYVSHFKLERLESLLSRSRYVQGLNPRLRWAGYYGRLMRMGSVSVCLLFPRLWLRRGLLDSADLAGFPKGLRLLVVVPLVTAIAGFAAIFLLNAIKG